MNEVLIATIGGLISFLFWGTSDWLAARNSKKYSGFEVNLALRPFGLIAGIVLLLMNYQSISGFGEVAPFIVVGVFFTAAYVFMIRALSTGSVGIIVPIVSANPLIALLLALCIGGTTLTLSQVMCILVIITGVLMLAYQKTAKDKSFKDTHKETSLAIISALGWGIGFFIINQNIANTSWQVASSVLAITMFAFATLLVVLKSKKQSLKRIYSIKNNKVGLIAGLLLTLANLSFFYSADRVGDAIIVIVIAAAAPLVASVLSAVFDHERLGYIKRLGAVLVVGGIILLNVL